MTKLALDGRTRDQDGEIRQKRDDTLVRTLRKVYGVGFLSDFRSDTTLRTVLKKAGARSLAQLIKPKCASKYERALNRPERNARRRALIMSAGQQDGCA